MRKIIGQTVSAFRSFLGEITTERVPFYARHDKILITNSFDIGCMGYLGIISSVMPRSLFYLPHMIGNIQAKDLSVLKHGDIVSVSDDGNVLVVWEIESDQNGLMLTEACNCRCMMCPQPPQKHKPKTFMNAKKTLKLLKGKHIEHICITGGEPTLLEKDFLSMLHDCHTDHPRAKISILTNAKKFSSGKFTKEVASVVTPNDTFCVSLHSDINSIHDEIVGKKGSYAETQEGIYNLAKNRINIELRCVITKQNYTRLLEFAEHMYRYFPFCSHYTFMSMETHGLAKNNAELVYIEAISYIDQLRSAVLALHKRGLHVSIYNTPLCLCHKDVRVFARDSISSWKKIFNDECSSCTRQKECCGFFSTSAIAISHLVPL